MKKIFTLILCLMMTVSLIGCSNKKNEAVATVNGETITLGNYEKLLALNKLSMESYYGSDIWSKEVEDGKTYKDTLKDMVLQTMISSEVVYQQAKKDKILPTDEQVQEQIDSFNEQVKNDKEYQNKLKKMGIDEEFLKYQFSRDLANNNLKAKFTDDTKISESEMKKYYEENKDDFYTDTVTASHILLKTIDDNGNELSDKKKKEAKKKAEEALKKVKSGEDFAQVAKEYSEDSTASNGGELGTFGKGQMVSEFENAAFSMKPGEISDIIKTQYGYHIIKVTERVDEQKSYDDVKDEIKSTLASQEYSKYIEKIEKNLSVNKMVQINNELEKQARERKRVIRAYKTLSNNKKVEELAQRLRERNIKHVILYYYSYATDLLINYADQLGIVIDYIVEDVKEPRRIPRLPYNTVNYPNCDAIINCNIRYPKLSKRKLEERTNNLIINAEDILDLRECL